MLRLLVRNFQSIAEAAVEVDGFTVVTGPSNAGKSALVRALGGALRGIPGDHYVRNGTNASEVLVYDDFSVRWKKVRKKRVGEETELEIDLSPSHEPQKFTRLGRDHAELTEGMGFDPVEAGGAKVHPQFAGQYDPPGFLLSDAYTPSTVADVFKSLGRADVVSRASGAAKRDLAAEKSKLAIHREDLRAAGAAQAELGWVLGMRDALTLLRGQVESLEQASDDANLGAAAIARTRELGAVQVPEAPADEVGALWLEFDVLGGLSGKVAALRKLEPVEVPEAGLEVLGHLKGMAACGALADAVAKLRNLAPRPDLMEALDVEEVGLLGAKESLEAEMGTCPTCGKSF